MKPKILLCDIETLPLETWTWGLFDQNIGLNQIKSDWTVLSWSAKWLGESAVFYEDVRHEKQVRNDRKILRGIWKLLDEADIVIWHYGSAFDHKKLNARFVLNGFKPPSPYKQLDTKKLATKHFGFTSNKLEYLADKLNKKYKKSKHKKYEGFSLWKACMEGDQEAFKEMERYNRLDVLALEELYLAIRPWGTNVDMGLHVEHTKPVCSVCGEAELTKYGYAFKNAGKYQRFRCGGCGAVSRGKQNLLSKAKKKALRPGV